jgi:hypothetical protein
MVSCSVEDVTVWGVGEEIRKSPSRCPLKLEDTILEKLLQYIYRPFEMLVVHIISGLAQVLKYNAAYDLAISHTGFASTEEITIGQTYALSLSFGLRGHRASGRVGGRGVRVRREMWASSMRWRVPHTGTATVLRQAGQCTRRTRASKHTPSSTPHLHIILTVSDALGNPREANSDGQVYPRKSLIRQNFQVGVVVQ